MDLKNKKIVLTGASSGIGLHLLQLLNKKQAQILAIGLDDNIPKLKNVTYLKMDVSKEANVDKIFEVAKQTLGDIDIFIANAGFMYYESVEMASWDKISKIFDTNVTSIIYSFSKLLELKKAGDFQFVITASAMSFMPLAGYGLYSATKHALEGFFESAHMELLDNQIITMIYPISTKTNFFKDDMPKPFPVQSAAKVAKSYLKGIEKNQRRIYPSKAFGFDNRFKIIQPLIKKREARQFKKWLKKKDDF